MARSRHGRRISSPIRDFAVRYPIISRRNGRPKRPKWNGWKGRRRFDGRTESSLTQRREEKWPKGRVPDNPTQRHKEDGRSEERRVGKECDRPCRSGVVL